MEEEGDDGYGSADGDEQKELNDKLKQNRNFILEIFCNQIAYWQKVIQNHAKSNAVSKLWAMEQNTTGDIEIQYIQDASGTQVNLDYFPVTVTQLPLNPNTGARFTADGFLSHIRTNLNDFCDTSITEFSPSILTHEDETAIWNSSNPETAVIHLDIAGMSGDGSVMCIESNPNNWTFATLEVPYFLTFQGFDGEHPVSGNREFGYTANGDGSYIFYTRGVDRINAEIDAAMAEHVIGMFKDPFDQPDKLWNSFKQGIYNFVESNAGSANPTSLSDNLIQRPDWNKVKDVLLGDRPSSDLGCK